MKNLIVILFLLTISACSHIDRQVEGFPQDLKKSEVLTGFWDVQSKCWDDMPLAWKLMLSVAIACTVIDLDAGTCTIYRFTDTLPDGLQEHEDAHCKGGAHDDGLQNYFDQWKASRRKETP